LSLVYIVEVALGIGFIIFVHELGHYIVAKLSNVKVERFSLGFGPEIVGFTRGETRYSLCILPFISYVKMLGEDPAGETVADPRSFAAQPFHKKAAIIVAGSFSNILWALVLFIAVFKIGVAFTAARVGGVMYGSPAYYAGIEPGDRIVSIAGRTDVDFGDIVVAAALSDPGKTLQLVVERDGRELPLAVRPDYDPTQGTGFIGVEPYPTLTVDGFASIKGSTSPVEKAGVKLGAVILAANGAPVTTWVDLQRIVVANGLKALSLTVSQSGAEKTVELTPLRSTLPVLGIAATQTTHVIEVTPDSEAAAMGLQAGDDITALGSTECANLHELAAAVTAHLDDLPPLKVMRGGQPLELRWDRPPLGGFDFILGFKTANLPRAAWVQEGSVAEMLGLQPGDDIAAVDGTAVTDFESIPGLLAKAKDDTIAVSWKRGAEEHTGSFQPVFIGLVPLVETVERKLGLAASCTIGVRKAWDFASQVYIIIRKAFTGQGAIRKSLRGPVAIAQASYKIAQQGFMHFVFFLAIIGINLGVVNLLPIPILDGGLLAMFVVEKVKGSPLSQAAQVAYQYVGIAIIGALIIFVTWQDIYRIVTGG
jgi:regulator of sigma E protease